MGIAYYVGISDEVELFSRICGKLQQFRRETAQRKENVAGLVPPARFGQAGNLGLQDAQVVKPCNALCAPLTLAEEKCSVVEFSHEVYLGAAIPAPVSGHLSNVEAEALSSVPLEPLATYLFEN